MSVVSRGFHNVHSMFDDWLLSPKDQIGTEAIQFLYDFSYLGHKYIDYVYDRDETKRYLKRYGLDYPDIVDFRRLPSSGSSSGSVAVATLNYVSRNLNRLYRAPTRSDRKQTRLDNWMV